MNNEDDIVLNEASKCADRMVEWARADIKDRSLSEADKIRFSLYVAVRISSVFIWVANDMTGRDLLPSFELDLRDAVQGLSLVAALVDTKGRPKNEA